MSSDAKLKLKTSPLIQFIINAVGNYNWMRSTDPLGQQFSVQLLVVLLQKYNMKEVILTSKRDSGGLM